MNVMIKFRSLLFFILFLCAFSKVAAATTSQVTVYLDAVEVTQLNYDTSIRLYRVLSDTLYQEKLNASDINWQSAALYHPRDIILQKHQIIPQLEQQISLVPKRERIKWQRVIEQLRLWHYAQRVETPIDIDLAWVNPDHNPALPGEWQLYLHTNHSRYIDVMGNIANPQRITWQPLSSAAKYIQEAGGLIGDAEFAYVIGPDGALSQHAVGDWQRQFKNIAPGSIIYVPLPSQAGSQYGATSESDANQLVIQLLKNRLP